MSDRPRPRTIFVTGGSGYVGRSLIEALLARGHAVRALVRPGSEGKLPAGCILLTGDALDAETFTRLVPPADTLVQLVGVPRPAPWKGALFRAVDRRSALAALDAAIAARIRHFVYVSVAQPAPVMRAYVSVRADVEARIRSSRIPATILRPWYVLGPGHRWPLAFVPVYALLARLPAMAEGARRLGLIELGEMTCALLWAVENPAGEEVRVLDVPAIKRLAREDAVVRAVR